MRFLIIGGDAAGMSAASRAKRNRPELEVTVLEQTADVSYSACGMPYNIADPGRDIEDLVVRRAEVFRDKQGIRLLTGHRAVHLDPAARCVTAATADGRRHDFPYDKLLLATGAEAVRPKLPGIDLPGVLVLKSLADGRAIKARLAERAVRRVVVLGMGYVALEMAEALRERGLAVTLTKPRPGLLPWMDPTLAAVVEAELRRHGVEVLDGRSVAAITPAGEALRLTGPDLDLTGEMVLAAVGIRPNSRLGAEAGLRCEVAGALAVDARQRTSDPHIYAAGDCADAFHVVTGKRVWIPLALRANRAGWAVADGVCGKDGRLPGVVGSAVFKVFALQVARTGLTLEEAREAGFEAAAVVIRSRSRAHSHPGGSDIHVQMVGDRGSGRLLGVQMVGREGVAHRLHAPAVALHAHMSVEQFSHTDLGYAPPFGPTWDPMLTAANQLLKEL